MLPIVNMLDIVVIVVVEYINFTTLTRWQNEKRHPGSDSKTQYALGANLLAATTYSARGFIFQNLKDFLTGNLELTNWWSSQMPKKALSRVCGYIMFSLWNKINGADFKKKVLMKKINRYIKKLWMVKWKRPNFVFFCHFSSLFFYFSTLS